MNGQMDTWVGGRCRGRPLAILSEFLKFPSTSGASFQLLPTIPIHPQPALARLPTTEALQDEVELAACLESIGQFHNEGVLHRLQNVPLSPCVCCVLGIAHDFGLEIQIG